MNAKQAKQIPIEVYLDKLGCKPKIIRKNNLWYSSPLRKEKTASFKVNKNLNTWYDFGAGVG
jgi:DNA primase